MFKSMLAVLTVIAAGTASAVTITDVSYAAAQTILSNGTPTAGLNFKVGDSTTYKLSIASFINGTMTMTVKSVDTNAVVLAQDVNVMGQAQSCTETLNPNNGQITDMTCNGQKQDPGDSSQITVVDSKEASVTVPAGTFDTLWVKAHNAKDNTDIEQWINPKLIPVLGLVKMLAPSQIGQMDVELQSFVKN